MHFQRSDMSLFCILALCAFSFTFGYIRNDVKINPSEIIEQDRIDRVFADLRQSILANGSDVIYLPTDGDTFDATLFNKTYDGQVWVGDGEITGIASLHRTGNFSITYNPLNPREAVIEGNAGLTDLQGKYSTLFELGPFGSHFGIAFKLSYVSLYFITDKFVLPSHIYLEECAIDGFSTLQVKLKGIGIFDGLVENTLIGTITQILEPLIMREVEAVTCKLLEDAVNGVNSTDISY